MAKVVRFHKFGGPEVLGIEDHPVRKPAADEVRIQVKAFGVNRAEALLRRGRYIEQPSFPSGLGAEAAGIVETVGGNVDGLSPGDVVSIIPPPSMVKWPTYGELAVVPAGLVVKHPPSLNFETAAALWMAYVTAYGALVDIAKLRRGDVVVIPAASSSVGLAAIQIANIAGAMPIAITRSAAKRELLLGAGANKVIVSEEEDVGGRLHEIAGPSSVRIIFDAVGGPTVKDLANSMSTDGILIQYGGLSPLPTPFPVETAIAKHLTLKGYVMHEIASDRNRLDAAKAFILGGLASHHLTPRISRTFAFEEIVDAHRYLESNEQFGKIVVLL